MNGTRERKTWTEGKRTQVQQAEAGEHESACEIAEINARFENEMQAKAAEKTR
jgi:hypothetical protein